jgi:phospho-N-acetylmuramoyl-pentapeptide-transferase
MINTSRASVYLWVDFILGSATLWGGLAFVVALVFMLATGRPMVTWLRNKQWRKEGESWTVREDTPDTHQKKQGTPSMGGMGIIASSVISFIAILTAFQLFLRVSYPSAGVPDGGWLVLCACLLLPLVLLLHGALGFADDWSKASGRGGLRARSKLLSQFALTVLFLVTVLAFTAITQKSGGVNLPKMNFGVMDDPYLLPLALLFLGIYLIGTCNAVNLTDGLDGLAAGLTVVCGIALALASIGTGESLSTYQGTIIVFVLALAGACLGFLNFNKYKAQVFMGDTGSLAIGAALAAAAILLRAVWLLPFVGFIFYVEMLSVTTQVLWFKYTKKKTGEGKRLFRRAPLHHHFELGGWSEWRVVLTFWGINLITSIIGLVLWHTGILPRFP